MNTESHFPTARWVVFFFFVQLSAWVLLCLFNASESIGSLELQAINQLESIGSGGVKSSSSLSSTGPRQRDDADSGHQKRSDNKWEKQTKEMDDDFLKIAWLITFPNSGTSYTLRLISSVTRLRTASNYARMRMKRKTKRNESAVENEFQPVFDDQPMGPFWGGYQPRNKTGIEAQKQRYVLTKTHCVPPCIWCPPKDYVKSIHYFQSRCGRAERPSSNGKLTKGFYPTIRVRKSIHLIRDPLDNIVSRFRYERSNGRSAVKYPDTRKGFRDYCRDLNKAFKLQHSFDENKYADAIIIQAIQHVPCYADFVRYVEWHNLAFVTENDLGLESLVIHYQDYYSKNEDSGVNQTSIEILVNFLEASVLGPAVPFSLKTYRHFFNAQEQAVIWKALSQLALKQTWQHLKRYAYISAANESSFMGTEQQQSPTGIEQQQPIHESRK